MKFGAFIFFISPLFVMAQVGINTTSPNALLDLDSNDQGVLVPRVTLTEIKTDLPVVNPNGGNLVNSTMVYNTQTINDVSPGFYYWETDHWVRVGADIGYMNFTSIALSLPAGVNSDTDFELEDTNYYKNVFRLTHNGADLDGIANGIHGRVLHLYNGDSSKDLKLVSESGSSSLSVNKFFLQNDVILKPGNAIIIFYDGLYANRWIVVRSDN